MFLSKTTAAKLLHCSSNFNQQFSIPDDFDSIIKGQVAAQLDQASRLFLPQDHTATKRTHVKRSCCTFASRAVLKALLHRLIDREQVTTSTPSHLRINKVTSIHDSPRFDDTDPLGEKERPGPWPGLRGEDLGPQVSHPAPICRTAIIGDILLHHTWISPEVSSKDASNQR
ncbi:hypothetical protein BC829DRAFT_448801 [Chytridium lagenaria]|nr:hypothetical protein BC829DRAFT_448801 [Chytridium lagenaria]